ncbi:MAG: glycosyltransferase [Acidiferrobacterales bacterium]
MSRILCVWELGTDLGHIVGYHRLARQLKEHGHEVVFALRDVSEAQALLGADDFVWFQAPIWLGRATQAPPEPVSYAEILQAFGYDDADGLLSMVKAWRSLFRAVDPDVLLFDHAPTALLAARGLRKPRIVIGNGFTIPPSISPMPSFRPWAAISTQRLRESEGRVLRTVNHALARLDEPPLRALFEIFQTEETFLCAFLELDHYPQRAGVEYAGPIFGLSEGVSPTWGSAGVKRIFAYLKPRYERFEECIAALARMPCDVRIYSPGVSAQIVARYQSARLRFGLSPYGMAAVEECDLGICHGGFNTTAAFLLTGKPVVILPMQLEQFLLAHYLQQQGLAQLIERNAGLAAIERIIRGALERESLANQARSFCEKYPDYRVGETVGRLAERCLRHLPSSSP